MTRTPSSPSRNGRYDSHNALDIILSLTRTSKVGYLRDIRRLTVALSRARLGLYIVGRREVFEGCYELREAFQMLLKRPDKLALVTGELWPSKRILAEESGQDVPGEAVMENAEHLGQYVSDMTSTRVEQLRAERGLPDGAALAQALPQGDVMATIDEGGEEGEGSADAEVPVDGFEAEEG